MDKEFEIDKIVSYLENIKNEITKYDWNPQIEKLLLLEIWNSNEKITISNLNKNNSITKNYEIAIELKKIVGQKLKETKDKKKTSFDELCLWIVKSWGGISSSKDENTMALIYKFFESVDNPNFERISSVSKVASFFASTKYAIYDSRALFSLNWIILCENAGKRFFPIPDMRNTKMKAFDVGVLIRLKNINKYNLEKIQKSNFDEEIFLAKNDAYLQYIELIKSVNEILWIEDIEKSQNLYYTEMLLFSISDNIIIEDIINKTKTNFFLK
ncbi:MAG: hypothetical protein C4K58_06580 [Flavobacteriaceae bacterium]|nr:MAG: hypothetical protein C4K58_06580 [Flavobacteriaceae bacterium]